MYYLSTKRVDMCVYVLRNYMIEFSQNEFLMAVLNISRLSLLICKGSGNTELCNVAQKYDEM
jgi:hypothetical protein